MADMNIVGGAFKLTATATQAGVQTAILSTENKFVDKNIVVEFTTPAAESPILTITDKTNPVTVGTANGGVFPLSNSLTGITSYTTPGWTTTAGLGAATDSDVQVGTIAQSTMQLDSNTIASGSAITPSTTATKIISISAGYEESRTLIVNAMNAGEKATATVSASQQASAPTIANTASAINEKTQLTIAPTTDSEDINKYYLAITANAPATTFTASNINKIITKEGYLDANTQIAANANTTSNSSLYYIPLPSGQVMVTASQQATLPIAAASTENITGKVRLNLTPSELSSGIDTYYIPINLTAPSTTFNAANINKTISNNGYIDNISAINASVLTNASTATYYIPVTSGVLTSGAGSVSASGTASGVVISVENNAPSGYYIEIEGSGAATVGTAGWVNTGDSQNSVSETKYISLNTATAVSSLEQGTVTVSEGYVPSTGFTVNFGHGTITSGSSSRDGYIDNTTVVPEDGYLYINAGYHPNTQISLATLIPDDLSYENAGNANILSGYEAYNSDGNKLVGTITTYDGSYTLS